LLLTLFDVRDTARPVRLSSAPLPLSEDSTLEWVGFSESGVLATVDSLGMVRGCLRSYGFEWVPLLDGKSIKKSTSEHHWVVGLTDKELLAVICKGEDHYPATLPRPVVTPLPLSMPLACSEPAEPAQEKERLLTALMLNEFRSTAVDNETDEADEVQDLLMKSFTKLDSQVLKLINGAMKHERSARALDLVTQLQLPKSLSSALRLANHYKQTALADRIGRLMEARFEDGAVEEDVEEAPKPQPRVVAPSRPKAAPQEKEEPQREEPQRARDEQADDEPEDEEPDEGAPSGRPPLNPFGAAAKASNGGKAVLAVDGVKETLKGPKRSLPVTSAVGGKRAQT
jgi:chromosome transmission fidelity protein 4